MALPLHYIVPFLHLMTLQKVELHLSTLHLVFLKIPPGYHRTDLGMVIGFNNFEYSPALLRVFDFMPSIIPSVDSASSVLTGSSFWNVN
jgi:hypothetical protein